VVYGGYAWVNGSGDATANNNQVTMTSKIWNQGIYGGSAGSVDGAATASGNSVMIEGGEGNSLVTGGSAFSKTLATASNNRVTVRNADTDSLGIIGGSANAGSGGQVNGSWTATPGSVGHADGNIVTIVDSVVEYVVGGSINTETGTATHNTIILEGDVRIHGALVGGNHSFEDAFTGSSLGLVEPYLPHGTYDVDYFTGNTLILNGVRNVQIGDGWWTREVFHGFETINFYLPADIGNGETILRVFGDTVIDGTTINLGIWGGQNLSKLQNGDAIRLIHATPGEDYTNDYLIGAAKAGQVKAIQGATLQYDFDIYQTGQTLWAKLGAGAGSGGGTGGGGGGGVVVPVVVDGAKVLSEGYLSGVASVVHGGGLAVRTGWQTLHGGAGGLKGFGTAGGVKLRVNTGSHVDVKGYNAIAGLSLGRDLPSGARAIVGGFFEYGNHDFNTFNSFPGARLKGSGDTRYSGLGLIGGATFARAANGYFHAEGAVRGGRVESKFHSTQLRDLSGLNARYESKAAYYSLAFGAGRVWTLNERGALDVYGDVLWTRQNGDRVALSTGENIKFSAVDSERARLGARYNHALGAAKAWNLFAGLAYEHEFNGKAKAKINNAYAIDPPDFKGGTTVLEAGVRLAPGKALNVDVGVQGYEGKNEGVAGEVRVGWRF
jgi:hypothetical protein